MSIERLQSAIRERKTPVALGLAPEIGKISAKLLKNFEDMFGPGGMANAETLRYHACQEFLCILYPSFHFRGSTSYNLTGKSAIKFRFRADAEGINITDSYVIILISQFAHRPFH